MVRKFTSLAFAGALMMVAAPAFADDLNLNPLGLPLVPNSLGQLPVIGGGGLDLDPLHIFAPAPAAAPAAATAKHHRGHHHHHLAHKMAKKHAGKHAAAKKAKK